jgi:hypothetical protein
MNLAEHPMLSMHAGRDAILDANLLILYWCSSFDVSLVHSFKRLNSFEPTDVYLLTETLKIFRSLSTTPHVLTETSNLANSLKSWKKQPWSEFFAERISTLPEIHLPASELASDPAALHFGITDAALTRLASKYVVLTIDWPLTGLLESRRLSVLNFNHVRDAILFS